MVQLLVDCVLDPNARDRLNEVVFVIAFKIVSREINHQFMTTLRAFLL